MQMVISIVHECIDKLSLMSKDDIQVSSTVPEGKGVSSSASVEVATMYALAAAHGEFISSISSL